MKQVFYKYQGTGNDFVMIDNRHKTFNKNNTKYIAKLCDRRFGIGADGLILLENHDECDFKMLYFNADGNQSTMCGNGGRCIVAFANFLGIIKNETTFIAIDGLHHSKIDDDYVELQMQDVSIIKVEEKYTFLDTGSPHHVELRDKVSTINVKEEGAEIRYSELYGKSGSNVNFVEKISEDTFKLRTYERGVEDETLSCGTGATAVAIAMNYIGETEKNVLNLHVEGGKLRIHFNREENQYTNVWLCGAAKQVFKGEL